MNKGFFATLLIVFLVVFAISYGIKWVWPDLNFVALIIANVLLFLLSVLSYFLVQGKLNKRPESFVTGVNASRVIKLMVCMAAAFCFVFYHKENLHKPSLIALCGIYIVYAVAETILLSKRVKNVSR